MTVSTPAPPRLGGAPGDDPSSPWRDLSRRLGGAGLPAVEQRAGRLATDFAGRFGAWPTALAAAPATVTLLGGPDGVYVGPSLHVAVDRHAVAAVGLGEGGRVEVLVDRDFPAGAGLAARAAERSAVRRALSELGRRDQLPWSAAELTARLGRPDTALVIGSAPREVAHVSLDLTAWDLSLIVFDTGARGSADGARARRHGLDRAAAQLGIARETATADQLTELSTRADPVASRCARHLLTERTRVATATQRLADGDVGALADLMNASHSSLSRDLRTTTRSIDQTVQAARAAGALGVRMTGAGLGGSVLGLVPTRLQTDVVTAVTESATRSGFLVPRAIPLTVTGRGWAVTATPPGACD